MCRIVTLVLFLLAACTPEATPFPVDRPQPTPEATEAPALTVDSTLPPGIIRYGLDVNTQGFVRDLPLLQASAVVEQLDTAVSPADLGTRFDLIAAYGDLPGGTRSPVVHTIALLVNPNAPPLDDPALAEAILQAVDATAIVDRLGIAGVKVLLASGQEVDLRSVLANAGWPDGFDLRVMDAGLPGGIALMEHLKAAGLDGTLTAGTEPEIEAALTGSAYHLALVSWTAPEQRDRWTALVGGTNVIDLFTLPISYLASPGLTISFLPDGWPLANR